VARVDLTAARVVELHDRAAPSRLSPVTTAFALAIGTALVYAPFLQRSPVYLAHDEVIFALNAYSLATTGRDIVGRYLPLYVGDYWATPLNIYLTALLLKIAPLSEALIRLPSVAVGIADVVLLYLLARRIFQRHELAVFAAVLLALTPAHFIHSRLGVDHLYPVPFVLGWLLCLVAFFERPRPWLLAVAGICLGVGFYSYLASEIMMPLLFLLTALVLVVVGRYSARAYRAMAAGFIMPLLPLIPWHLTHPAQFAQQMKAYGLFSPSAASPLHGVAGLFSYSSISTRVSVYYNFFNPSLLFLTGDSSIVNSTRRAGVFLLPVAVLLVLGIHRLIVERRTPIGLVLLIGLAVSPVAAVVVGEVMINRALFMLPFVAMIATYGFENLITAERKAWRATAACLVAAMAVQFAAFETDYLTGYRVRSSRWFERNIRGAMEEIIARDRQGYLPAIFMSREIVWINSYWRLYAIMHHREDLLTRTVYFDPRTDDVQAMPWQSLMLANYGESRDRALVTAGKLRDVTEIGEPDGTPSFSLFARN